MNRQHYDVVVAGGGISGTMAAIAAASDGCRTLLIERYAALGGMATLGLVQPITTWGLKGHYVVGGRGRKLLESLRDTDLNASTPLTHYGPTCDTEHLKRRLEEAALDAGVSLLYHTWITGIQKKEDVVTQLNLFSKAGAATIAGDVIIDATGDADIASYAGVPCVEDSQGITLMFIVAGIKRKQCPPLSDIQSIWQKHKIVYRSLALFWHPREDAAYMNVTEVEGRNGLDPWDLTEATITCRKQAWQILDILKAHVSGFEDAYIEQTASALGVRETRRIQGRYLLTKEDALTGADFPDTIARAGCPVDVHGAQNNGLGDYRALSKSYGVPYRCLTTELFRNLIVTGRPISTDHTVHSSVRRMAPGSALGEAAGVAASMAIKGGGDVRSVSVPDLRRELVKHGAILTPEPGPDAVNG